MTTFSIDGVNKQIDQPTTGNGLYKLAGNPATLKTNGALVAKNDTAVTVTEHQVFTTK
jgi:hypothetical protein